MIAPGMGPFQALAILLPAMAASTEAAGAADLPGGRDATAQAPIGFEEPPAQDGPFLGDRYRWSAMPVLARVGWDLVAIPADVPRWSAGEWAQLGVSAGAVAVLMLPPRDPLDARLDRWLRVHADPWAPLVWNDTAQPVLWASIAIGGLGTWWWAASHDRSDIAQGLSLMGESLAVAQAYHVTVKLLVGREGPRDGDRRGRIRGPFQTLDVYPAGTPSGHAATLYALLSSGLGYFRPPAWVAVAGHLTAGTLVTFHVVNHRHFLSDSLAGSLLGWSVGGWVVAHRSSRLEEERPLARSAAAGMALVPIALNHGAGLAVAGVF
jgi:hypothetical protein